MSALLRAGAPLGAKQGYPHFLWISLLIRVQELAFMRGFGHCRKIRQITLFNAAACTRQGLLLAASARSSYRSTL